MTTTRRFIFVLVLFSTCLTLHAQTLPLSIRQPFAALSEIENHALRKIDTALAMSEGYAPIEVTLKIQLSNIITRLTALPDVGKGEVAVPLAVARTFQANDDCLYGYFKGSIQLSDAAIEALQTHARDTGAIYTLALAYGIKAYDLENLLDLEAALLERDKGIEAFKRIGYATNIITERLNKAKIYVYLGDEKAGLKELMDYDQRKLAYEIERYVKQDVLSLSVRSALSTLKGSQEHLLGEVDSAQFTYKKALLALEEAAKNVEKCKASFGPDELRTARYMIQVNMGATYTNIRIPERADSILACAARAEVLIQGASVETNLLKGWAWIVKRDFKNAKKTIQAVMHNLIDPKTDTANIFSTPSVNVHNIPYLQTMATVYFQKGLLLVAMYDSSKMQNKENLDYLKHAFYCYQKAITVVDTLRMSFSTDATMQNVVKSHRQIYAPAILVASYLYEATHSQVYLDSILRLKPKLNNNVPMLINDVSYLDTMLRLAEQRKTFTLRQAVYSRINREKYSGETRRLYEQEAQLKRDLIIAQNTFGINPIPKVLQNLNAAHANYRQFKGNLRKLPFNTEGGRYYAERFADSVPTIKDIQRDWLATKKGEVPRVFLSYTFSPTHIIALLVTADTARPYVRETTPQLWTLLKQVTQSIEYQKTFPNAAAYQLYETLLEDILRDVPKNAHLIISAEGQLLRLPFEALLTQPIDSKDNNYPKMPFLIRKYRVSYLPSLTTQMWLRTFHASAKPIKQKIGIVKGYYVLGENRIPDLMNTADSVARFFNKAATVFDNNKTPFMLDDKEESDLTDLFFVLHGEASATNPLDYSLILKDSKDSVLTRLTVEKIQQMRFKKLNSVVFGACETQHGELDSGEGVFSIARAFQGLGCRHIVGTLNSVPIEQTARLLNNFYYNYKGRSQQLSLSEALHEAKKGYLNTTRREECHPHCWANIIYIGDN